MEAWRLCQWADAGNDGDGDVANSSNDGDNDNADGNNDNDENALETFT